MVMGSLAVVSDKRRLNRVCVALIPRGSKGEQVTETIWEPDGGHSERRCDNARNFHILNRGIHECQWVLSDSPFRSLFSVAVIAPTFHDLATRLLTLRLGDFNGKGRIVT